MSNTKKKIYPTELRKCIKCGEEKQITQRNPKAKNNICNECGNTYAREYAQRKAIEDGKRVGIKGRLPYPGGYEETGRDKFLQRKKELDKIKDREVWIEVIRQRFEEIINNKELMDYINARGDNASEREERMQKEEKEDIHLMTWEDYERGGWGEPEDS